MVSVALVESFLSLTSDWLPYWTFSNQRSEISISRFCWLWGFCI